MRLNPEFRRYMWMELSPFRVIGMPVVLGGIFLLAGIATHESGEPAGGTDMYETLVGTAIVAAILITLFWSTRLAASALVQEVADKTWDAQRLSSLGPWGMTWGKLLGSTVYAWYGTALALAVMAVSFAMWDSINGGVARAFGTDVGVVIVQSIIGVVAFGVMVQATALVAALTAMHQRETTRRFDVSLAQFAALVVAIVVSSMLDRYIDGPAVWYGQAVDGRWFAVVSVVVFALWAVIGVWRRMQIELQVRTLPWVWPVFVIFVAAWMTGLAWPERITGTYRYVFPIVFGAVIIIFASYVPALFERLDPVRIRHLLASMRAGRFASVLADAPLWLINHGVALIAVAATTVYIVTLPNEDAAATEFQMWVSDGTTMATVAGTLIALFLFVTRDLLLLTYAYLGQTTRRAVAGWLIWLAVLYLLIPAILSGLGMFSLLPVFVPIWDVPFVDFAVPPVVWPLIHIAVVAVLLTLRWRRFSSDRITAQPGTAGQAS